MLESRRRYYFLAIAEHLNITKAAASLYIAQPSLTQYLNQLEKELDAKLVDRKYSPLRLTQAGQTYYDYLKDAQYKEQVMRAKIASETAGENMPLRLGVPMQKSQNVTETIISHFTNMYPRASYSIWEGTTTTVRSRVIQEELDIGFGHTHPGGDEECDVVPLRKERVVIVCNRNNPIISDDEATLEKPLRVAPEALADQRSYEMGSEYILRDAEKDIEQRFGLKPGKRIIMSHLYSRLSDLLSHPNSGYAIIPDFVFTEEFPKSVLPQLAILRLGEEDYTWYFSMLRKKGKKHSADAIRFWSCIEKQSEIAESTS